MKTGHSVTIYNLVKICGHKRRAPSSGQMESAATEEIIMSSSKPGRKIVNAKAKGIKKLKQFCRTFFLNPEFGLRNYRCIDSSYLLSINFTSLSDRPPWMQVQFANDRINILLQTPFTNYSRGSGYQIIFVYCLEDQPACLRLVPKAVVGLLRP